MSAIDEASNARDMGTYNELKSNVCELKERNKRAEEDYYGG